MHITYRYILMAFAGLLFSIPLYPAESDWEKAKKEFLAESKNHSEEVRINVTAKLTDNMAPPVEGEVVILLSNQIFNELNRGRKGKKEEAVSIRVIDTYVEGLRRIKEAKAVKMLMENASRQNENWRFRFYVIKALGSINTPTVIKELMSLINDRKIRIQVAAFRALGQLKTTEALEPASELLMGKANWRQVNANWRQVNANWRQVNANW